MKKGQRAILLNNGRIEIGTIESVWISSNVVSAITPDGKERIYEPGYYIILPMLLETLDLGIFK